MTRDELAEALGEGEAHRACHEYLEAGARLEVSDALVPTRELVTIYRRRLELVTASGSTTLGMAEAVDALGTTTLDQLRIGHVEQGDSGWLFQVFLHPVETVVVACFAIERA